MLPGNLQSHAADADGLRLRFEEERLTAKCEKDPLVVESTFGAVTVSRWACQSSCGVWFCCPQDRKRELPGSATPKLTRSAGFKHAHAPAAEVAQALEENHGRTHSL